jgi:transposase
MRGSFDALSSLVNSHMEGDLLSGDLFLFINKKRNQLKLLQWSQDGFAIYHKKLQKGTFELPDKPIIQAYELQLLLQGIVVEKVRKKTRFSLK